MIDARTPPRADAFAAAGARRAAPRARSLSLDLAAGRGRVLRAQRPLAICRSRSSSSSPTGSPPRSRCSGCCRRASTAPPCSTWRHARCGPAPAQAETLPTASRSTPRSRACSTARARRREPLAWRKLDLDRRRAAQHAAHHRAAALARLRQDSTGDGRDQRGSRDRRAPDAAEPEPVTVRLTGSVAMEHEELASVTLGRHRRPRDAARRLRPALRRSALVAPARDLGRDAVRRSGVHRRVRRGDRRPPESALDRVRGAERRARRRLRDPRAAALQRARRGGQAEPALLETMRDVGSLVAARGVHDGRRVLLVHPHAVPGVSELGWIAGTGVFFGLFAATTLLPALVVLFARRARAERRRWSTRGSSCPSPAPARCAGVTAVVIVASPSR